MTREQCEEKLLEKMKELWNIYKEYNPNGTYLTGCVFDDENGFFIDVHNAHYPDGRDATMPLDANYKKEDEENE